MNNYPGGCRTLATYAEERSAFVRYYDGAQWYYICADSFSTKAAYVVCGDRNRRMIQSISISYVNIPSDALVYNYSFNCDGHEQSLCNCSVQPTSCNSEYVVSMKCTISGNVMNRSLRIVT